MKIRIITIHGIPNFGSVFQSYALCKYLREIGFDDTQVIDYNPEYFNEKTFRAIVGKMLNYKSFRLRKKKFRDFVEKNIPLTEKGFSTLQELNNHEFGADVYIAGGDQLWNVFHSSGRDDSYRLVFTKGKKISYSTSMGQKNFPEDELKKLACAIKDFSAVSVREKTSVEQLKQQGINAVQCVDPVYLLNREDYSGFIKPVNQPDYLLVYLVTPSKLLEDSIDYISKKYNLKVILCSGFSKKCTCDEFLKDLGPDEILSYIANAKIVLSSSFHATSFSLIFKKQFFTILPNVHTNERIESLLEHCQLSHRIITDKTDLEKITDNAIDYSDVADFSDLIDKSKEYLKKALCDD